MKSIPVCGRETSSLGRKKTQKPREGVFDLRLLSVIAARH
jgi:hypothetical protein